MTEYNHVGRDRICKKSAIRQRSRVALLQELRHNDVADDTGQSAVELHCERTFHVVYVIVRTFNHLFLPYVCKTGCIPLLPLSKDVWGMVHVGNQDQLV